MSSVLLSSFTTLIQRFKRLYLIYIFNKIRQRCTWVLHDSTEGVTRAFLTNKKVLGGAIWLRRCQRNYCSGNHLLEQRRPGYDRRDPDSLYKCTTSSYWPIASTSWTKQDVPERVYDAHVPSNRTE
jgi:hypothetical protein